MTRSLVLEGQPPAGQRSGGSWRRLALMADAAWRLGPRPSGLWLLHRLHRASGIARLSLPDQKLPSGRLLPETQGAPPPVGQDVERIAGLAAELGARGWHGPFAPARHGLALDLFGPGDIRPIWEANRLLAVPLLAMAARLAPEGGYLYRAEALLHDWCAANPPFRGPAWACGQEAALRALHLCLGAALLDADREPSAALRHLLGLHARRILVTGTYAAAQDNNHAVSEPAGLFVIALVCGDAAAADRAAKRLGRAVLRLVGEGGAFAQASPAYHRLLLDTLSLAEWFRRRHAAPAFPPEVMRRARAATLWLHQVMAPSGGLPRSGAGDDSTLADLSLSGAHDARGSLERAARLFCDASAGFPDDAGCAWLDLGLPAASLPPVGPWRAEGWTGDSRGTFRLLLRTGAPLRFRPAQADLLHLELWDGDEALLRDGGTGSYNPAPGCEWWTDALSGTAGHNTVQFDGEEQMPRLSRFLLARWPQCRALPHGAALRDAKGREHERRFLLEAGRLTVEDRLAGPFREARLRWRLAPGEWVRSGEVIGDGRTRLSFSADGPFGLELRQGWESPAYGEIRPAPMIELTIAAPASRITTLLERN